MNYRFFSDSTLDRTSQWVAASRESLNHLTGPALPPKPSIIPTHGILDSKTLASKGAHQLELIL